MSIKTAPWSSQPIANWLLTEGRFAGRIQDLVAGLGQHLHAAGAPLWRLRFSTRTLHPLITGYSIVWERGREDVEYIDAPHGLEQRSAYVDSPLAIMAATKQPYHRNLSDTLNAGDHQILHDIKARGGTDYYGLPMVFSQGLSASLLFVSDDHRGFSDADFANFQELSLLLAPIAELFNTQKIARVIAQTYLGPGTGDRVLAGQITKGHIQKLDAAIMISDLRNWTNLNNRLLPQDALELCNRYFEILAKAIESHGGEILKLMGDGVLAVFPTDGINQPQACNNAYLASIQALEKRDPQNDLDFGIGLHVGEVLYGNVGSKSRLDFTVLGKAVNRASRIEALCREFQAPLLYSKTVADNLQATSRPITTRTLKGDDQPIEIMAPV